MSARIATQATWSDAGLRIDTATRAIRVDSNWTATFRQALLIKTKRWTAMLAAYIFEAMFSSIATAVKSLTMMAKTKIRITSDDGSCTPTTLETIWVQTL